MDWNPGVDDCSTLMLHMNLFLHPSIRELDYIHKLFEMTCLTVAVG